MLYCQENPYLPVRWGTPSDEQFTDEKQFLIVQIQSLWCTRPRLILLISSGKIFFGDDTGCLDLFLRCHGANPIHAGTLPSFLIPISWLSMLMRRVWHQRRTHVLVTITHTQATSLPNGFCCSFAVMYVSSCKTIEYHCNIHIKGKFFTWWSSSSDIWTVAQFQITQTQTDSQWCRYIGHYTIQ